MRCPRLPGRGRKPDHAGPHRSGKCAHLQAASPAVANIVTRAVQYDFFFDAVPVEGAGSGFVIDTDGPHPDELSRGRGRADDRSDARRSVALQSKIDRRGHPQRYRADSDRSEGHRNSRRCRWAIRGICWWASACSRSAILSDFRARSRRASSARSAAPCKPAKTHSSTKRFRPMPPSIAEIPAVRC